MKDIRDPDLTEQILGLLAHVGPARRGFIQFAVGLSLSNKSAPRIPTMRDKDNVNDRLELFVRKGLVAASSDPDDKPANDRFEITKEGIEHLREVSALRLGF